MKIIKYQKKKKTFGNSRDPQQLINLKQQKQSQTHHDTWYPRYIASQYVHNNLVQAHTDTYVDK